MLSALSCPPAAPRLPCGCRRRCTGFPSASFYPSHASSCIAISKKPGWPPPHQKNSFRTTPPGVHLQGHQCNLAFRHEAERPFRLRPLLFPASPEFSAISRIGRSLNTLPSSLFSNVTLQRSKKSISGNGKSVKISATFCSYSCGGISAMPPNSAFQKASEEFYFSISKIRNIQSISNAAHYEVFKITR